MLRRVDLERGLYVLRYVSATDSTVPPVFEISVAEEQRSAVTLIPFPGERAGLLSLPGDFLVVRALTRSFIKVRARPRVRNGSIAGELRLENLETSAAGWSSAQPDRIVPPVPSPERPGATPALERPQLRVLAHLSRTGDVSVGDGEWVGGPQMRRSMEGFAVSWLNKPADVDIICAAELGGSVRTVAPKAKDGFVGTRGRAVPLVSVNFQLTGSAADDFYIVADGLFSDASLVSKRGKKVSLSGPTGTEALVGLRLSVEARGQIVGAPVRQSRAGGTAVLGSSRAKVFRRSMTADRP